MDAECKTRNVGALFRMARYSRCSLCEIEPAYISQVECSFPLNALPPRVRHFSAREVFKCYFLKIVSDFPNRVADPVSYRQLLRFSPIFRSQAQMVRRTFQCVIIAPYL